MWLDSYNKCRNGILTDLKRYKKEVNDVKQDISGRNLIHPIPELKAKIKPNMCFVDGGEGISELLGAAVYFIRASGLILEKEGTGECEETGSCRNCGKFVRDLDMGIVDYDEHTKERIELLRGAMEFDVATRCIEENDAEYVFLDGSLYVNYKRNPVDCVEYEIYRKKFARLLKLCKKKSVHITGVSEDSRSKLFANYLSIRYDIKFPKFMTDSSILRLLGGDTKYRTILFMPPSRFESEGITSSALTTSFPTVYVQPTELANPLRIDVPEWEKDKLDEIIGIITELSKKSKQYGYPVPLYLAHLDAKIAQKHAEWSTTQLIHYISKHDLDLYNAILRERRRGFRP